jgi:hypothetical protein
MDKIRFFLTDFYKTEYSFLIYFWFVCFFIIPTYIYNSDLESYVKNYIVKNKLITYEDNERMYMLNLYDIKENKLNTIKVEKEEFDDVNIMCIKQIKYYNDIGIIPFLIIVLIIVIFIALLITILTN